MRDETLSTDASRYHTAMRWMVLLVFLALPLLAAGCAASPGEPLRRSGDEIMVCGQLFHTQTPVVLWTDPGGYDAYRVERRFVPSSQSSWAATTQQTKDIKIPNRFDLRDKVLTPAEIEQVRGGGWTLAMLREKVDQLVIHYDDSGTSRGCFQTLQDERGLSVHFMIDLDGTVYQTLDVKEKAWQATIANSRSVGIELANRGAATTPNLLKEWYATDSSGRTRVTIPAKLGDGGERTPNFIARPIRNDLVRGEVQGQYLVQYDFTPQQYSALIHLTAALCRTLPRIKVDYPRDSTGKLMTHKLSDAEFANFHGILGHYHVQSNKIDPGPAFQWDRLIDGVRALM